MGLRPVLERKQGGPWRWEEKMGGGGEGENSSSTEETCVHALASVCVCSQRETVGEV